MFRPDRADYTGGHKTDATRAMDETSGLPRAGAAPFWYHSRWLDRRQPWHRRQLCCCIVAFATWPGRHLLPRSLSLYVSGSNRITGFPVVDYYSVAH